MLALTALPTVEQELMVGYYFREEWHCRLSCNSLALFFLFLHDEFGASLVAWLG